MYVVIYRYYGYGVGKGSDRGRGSGYGRDCEGGYVYSGYGFKLRRNWRCFGINRWCTNYMLLYLN